MQKGCRTREAVALAFVVWLLSLRLAFVLSFSDPFSAVDLRFRGLCHDQTILATVFAGILWCLLFLIEIERTTLAYCYEEISYLYIDLLFNQMQPQHALWILTVGKFMFWLASSFTFYALLSTALYGQRISARDTDKIMYSWHFHENN